MRGSYTVEAVFLFPMIILLMAFMLHLSIRLYSTVEVRAQDIEMVLEIDSLQTFWKISQAKQVISVGEDSHLYR